MGEMNRSAAAGEPADSGQDLRRRSAALAAFTGWNDAGGAASEALCHIEEEWGARMVASLPADDYVDFQMNRPTLSPVLDISDDAAPVAPAGMSTMDSRSEIVWPDTLINHLGHDEDRPLFTVQGPEPSLKWRAFCTELLDELQQQGVEVLVVLGALLADAPHTRPLPISATWRACDLQPLTATETSAYEGPIGIPTVLVDMAVQRGIPTLSLWVQVPNYVGQAPAPKAVLGLVKAVERELQLRIPLGDLEDDAKAWELGLNELAQSEEDIGEYVQQLEQARDAADLPEASGEAIADEFEQFLRRRGDD
ncbi:MULTISPECIES: PAC2 family protein [Helcobacillus]|uniref:PAC2 family protein n=1 Tax=Helcobacillus TaxID=1161125 RepID=UPI001EF653E5|nr:MULTISPECIES: PAC2 family protein [Helcobacillus]MDK7741154.1 PAC2 family protein [Helcobacillus massiliensis]WOO93961.1 PAC2 family protein [Helcobacillus massiliensis]